MNKSYQNFISKQRAKHTPQELGNGNGNPSTQQEIHQKKEEFKLKDYFYRTISIKRKKELFDLIQRSGEDRNFSSITDETELNLFDIIDKKQNIDSIIIFINNILTAKKHQSLNAEGFKKICNYLAAYDASFEKGASDLLKNEDAVLIQSLKDYLSSEDGVNIIDRTLLNELFIDWKNEKFLSYLLSVVYPEGYQGEDGKKIFFERPTNPQLKTIICGSNGTASRSSILQGFTSLQKEYIKRETKESFKKKLLARLKNNQSSSDNETIQTFLTILGKEVTENIHFKKGDADSVSWMFLTISHLCDKYSSLVDTLGDGLGEKQRSKFKRSFLNKRINILKTNIQSLLPDNKETHEKNERSIQDDMILMNTIQELANQALDQSHHFSNHITCIIHNELTYLTTEKNILPPAYQKEFDNILATNSSSTLLDRLLVQTALDMLKFSLRAFFALHKEKIISKIEAMKSQRRYTRGFEDLLIRDEWFSGYNKTIIDFGRQIISTLGKEKTIKYIQYCDQRGRQPNDYEKIKNLRGVHNIFIPIGSSNEKSLIGSDMFYTQRLWWRQSLERTLGKPLQNTRNRRNPKRTPLSFQDLAQRSTLFSTTTKRGAYSLNIPYIKLSEGEKKEIAMMFIEQLTKDCTDTRQQLTTIINDFRAKLISTEEAFSQLGLVTSTHFAKVCKMKNLINALKIGIVKYNEFTQTKELRELSNHKIFESNDGLFVNISPQQHGEEIQIGSKYTSQVLGLFDIISLQGYSFGKSFDYQKFRAYLKQQLPPQK